MKSPKPRAFLFAPAFSDNPVLFFSILQINKYYALQKREGKQIIEPRMIRKDKLKYKIYESRQSIN